MSFAAKKMRNSFGEYACIVNPITDESKRYNAIFRIGKVRPSYAEVVCISNIFKSRIILRRVDISAVKSWKDFVQTCKDIAIKEGFEIQACNWSFSCRF